MGYFYILINWMNVVLQNVYSGIFVVGFDKSVVNFKNKWFVYVNYDDIGMSVIGGDKIIGLNVKGGYKNFVISGNSGEFVIYGVNWCVVLVFVILFVLKIIDYVCMLMLQFIDGVYNMLQFEFFGNVGFVSSLCLFSGLVGGSKGFLVLVLVQQE